MEKIFCEKKFLNIQRMSVKKFLFTKIFFEAFEKIF